MKRQFAAAAFGISVISASFASAQTDGPRTLSTQPTLNFYGLPGLMDMPSAAALDDGTLAFTVAHFANTTRGTLSFQVLPRVTATFRYAAAEGFNPEPNAITGGNAVLPPGRYHFDRSFDLHWLAIEEDRWWPAIAIGIRDIAGTGVFGGEYVVATRHFGANDQFAVTAGIGWGRLGERNGFTNPLGAIDPAFETRPDIDFGQGGTFSVNQWFRGDAAFFGGIEWQASDRLRLQLEYSSDTYRREVEDGLLTTDSPFNFGATYQLGRSATVGAHYLYGDTFGISFSLLIDPRRPAAPTLTDRAPIPVVPRPARPAGGSYSTDWTAQPDGPAILSDNLSRFLEEENLEFVGLNLSANRAVLRVRNTHYGFESQALGRAMRVLSVTMPHSVEVFEVIFVASGLEVSRVRMNRTDVEQFEHAPDGAIQAIAAADVEDVRLARDPELIEIMGQTSRFTWGIAPYIDTALFDPATPFRADIGIQAMARYEFGQGFVLDGEVRARLFGNLNEQRRVDGPSAIEPVRTNTFRYNQDSDARVERLTFSHYGRPGRNLYSRVSVGYLERMFAGASAELLWRPVNSRIGLGVEINHVWQRDFDGGLGVQDYNVTMGHVSAYFDLGENFEAQVDVGRYLAGDYGGTVRLERVFNNGWRVGAFATFTDVSFEDFGEGSFDKGITLTIPIGWAVGNSTRQAIFSTIRPIQRDGGATLNIEGRLNDLVTDYHQPRLEDTQGVIWR